MAYMILPMPKEGSMTLGTISSTVGDTQRSQVSQGHVDTIQLIFFDLTQVRSTRTISNLVDRLIFSYDGR